MKSSKANAYIKVKVAKRVMRGGVLPLIVLLLSFSLLFTACSNGDEDSASYPDPTLPENQGENPVDKVLGENATEKKSIKLNAVSFDGIDEELEDYFFELETDGSATYYYNSDTSIKYPSTEFKYTYNETDKEIYMKIEKAFIGMNDDKPLLYTYKEILSQRSKIKEDFIKKQKEDLKYDYNNNKSLQDEYQEYSDYEKAHLEEYGFKSFDEMFDEVWKEQIYYLEQSFSAVITYKYEIKDGKMIITEKFTGIKNMRDAECYYRDDKISIYIYNSDAYFKVYNDSENDRIEYCTEDLVPFGADKIIFHRYEYDENDKRKIIDTITAPYKEDLEKEAVLLTIKGKEYTCKFEGNKYIQE